MNTMCRDHISTHVYSGAILRDLLAWVSSKTKLSFLISHWIPPILSLKGQLYCRQSLAAWRYYGSSSNTEFLVSSTITSFLISLASLTAFFKYYRIYLAYLHAARDISFWVEGDYGHLVSKVDLINSKDEIRSNNKK